MELSINESLIITIIVVMWIVKGILNIIAGAWKFDKATKYGNGDIAFGIIYLIIIFIILLF